MTDDWSGGEEEGGSFELPSVDDILSSLGFDQDEYERQVDEALGFLITELNVEQGVDPFAEDADLIPFDDPFADDELDGGTMDWRDMVSEDFDGDLRGPFPGYEDALEYIEGLEFASWEVVYDDLDDVWYAQLAYGVQA